jgi:hypothetical protein
MRTDRQRDTNKTSKKHLEKGNNKNDDITCWLDGGGSGGLASRRTSVETSFWNTGKCECDTANWAAVACKEAITGSGTGVLLARAAANKLDVCIGIPSDVKSNGGTLLL